MSTQLQIRRDTAANIALSTPVSGEIWYDTTNRRINIGDGSNVGGIEVPNYIDVQNGSFDYASAGGTANALTISTFSNPTAYAAGQRVRVKVASNNTSSATINWGSLGVKTIKKYVSGALENLDADDLVAGQIVTLDYDGTYFVLSGGLSSSGWDLISSTTISGSPQTLDFADIFVSGKNYKLNFTSVKISSNASLLMNFGSSGTSFDTSSNYRWSGNNTLNNSAFQIATRNFS